MPQVALGEKGAVEDKVGGAWALAPPAGAGRAAADLLERGGPRLYGGDMKRYSKVYERALRATVCGPALFPGVLLRVAARSARPGFASWTG